MKATLLARLGAITVVTTTTLAGISSPGYRDSDGFQASLTGAARTVISGQASFGRIAGGKAAPDVFTLQLEGDSTYGAVQFVRPSRSRLTVGSYRISDLGDDAQVQALVVLGPAESPQGVFRGESGVLTITSVSDKTLTGLFVLNATGFTADEPDREDRRLHVSGSFTAHSHD